MAKLQQSAHQSIVLHTTEIDSLLLDLNKPRMDIKLISIFIRSLDSETLRYILFARVNAYVESNANHKYPPLSYVVDQALNLEQNVFDHPPLHEDNSTVSFTPIPDEDVDMGQLARSNSNGHTLKMENQFVTHAPRSDN